MQFKQPKNDAKYVWTDHVKRKMIYYGISEGLIKRIVRVPKRIEEGVAPKTTAVMQPTSSKKQEIWVMYQELEMSSKSQIKSLKPEKLSTLVFGPSTGRKRIISAWRYPGVSPIGKKISIPDDILEDLEEILK